jgi:hypothetical protein
MARPTPAELAAIRAGYAALQASGSPNSSIVETVVLALGDRQMLMSPETAEELRKLRAGRAWLNAAVEAQVLRKAADWFEQDEYDPDPVVWLRRMADEAEAEQCTCTPEREHDDHTRPATYLHTAGCPTAEAQEAADETARLREVIAERDTAVATVAEQAQRLATREREHNADRAERDGLREELRFLRENTLPELRRTAEHHEAGKKRWRDRAERAEAERDELRQAMAAEPRATDEAVQALADAVKVACDCEDGRANYQARDGEFVSLPCRNCTDAPSGEAVDRG